MYEIQIDIRTARIIRDALACYKERWAGGDPLEQQDIESLYLGFQRILFESLVDG